MTRVADNPSRFGADAIARLKKYSLAIAGLLLFLALVAYGFAISRSPDFEVGLVRYTRPAMLGEGVTIRRECDAGVVLIRAERMRPGHEKIRGMHVGPSSFIALEQLDVRVVRDGQPDCTIRGESGELTPRKLTILGEPRLEIEGAPPPACKEVVVDLRTASVHFR